ncbi:MAG: FAD-dependent monooxygenase [Lachnospiraceae bacterium]|nr:FAD-dependent monooxygenase [Lachnospiraceae bacterium]
MYRIDSIKLKPPVNDERTELAVTVAKLTGLGPADINNLTILRRSIDARRKPDIIFVYNIAFDLTKPERGMKLLTSSKHGVEVKMYKPEEYQFQRRAGRMTTEEERPVVVGAGPAGLFCAYVLAMNGLRPIILERGSNIDKRTADVKKFWESGILDKESNVQFGEGGAGTFSDGKLNSSVAGKSMFANEVLRTFVRFGADKSILYSNKPHIGTDELKRVIKNMRKELENLGAEFHFECKLTRCIIREGILKGIRFKKNGESRERACRYMILCIGHSARDTFYSLSMDGIIMEPKPFAVGLRVQHPQEMINRDQYGPGYEKKKLPVADYKLTYKAASGRGVYSFCMCPGGYIVNASSEEGHLAVNGMSYNKRDSGWANSAIVVTVDRSIYGEGLFGGVSFQRELEMNAYNLGRGSIPIERAGDYFREADAEHLSKSEYTPAVKGKYRYAPLHELLPRALYNDIKEAFGDFDRKLPGFANDNALFAGVESRTSSPVRMIRGESLESSIEGIYPCGEGAGYAGGITSAAADGMKVAEALIKKYF